MSKIANGFEKVYVCNEYGRSLKSFKSNLLLRDTA